MKSKSHKGVIRGLHYQLPPFAQTKLVRVINGRVLDVAVDIRKNSPTFGKHIKVELSGQNKKQLLVPRGFAHGFVVLENDTIFTYKVDSYYHLQSERSIAYNDPQININWELQELLLSPKDKNSPLLAESKDLFIYDINYYE